MASARVFNHVLYRRYTIALNMSDAYKSCCFNLRHYTSQNALYSTKKSMVKLDPDRQDDKVQVGVAEVVKENVKTAMNFGVLILGGGVIALIMYTLWKELLSPNSVQGVYKRAFERCLENNKVVDALGSNIKACGEESRRGRRGHIRYNFFMKDGVKHMRMTFYLKGSRRQGTVVLEVKENERSDFEYTYLYVIIQDILKTVIKIEDNRQNLPTSDGDLEPIFS